MDGQEEARLRDLLVSRTRGRWRVEGWEKESGPLEVVSETPINHPSFRDVIAAFERTFPRFWGSNEEAVCNAHLMAWAPELLEQWLKERKKVRETCDRLEKLELPAEASAELKKLRKQLGG